MARSFPGNARHERKELSTESKSAMADTSNNPNDLKYQTTSERSQAAQCTKLVGIQHCKRHLEELGDRAAGREGVGTGLQ